MKQKSFQNEPIGSKSVTEVPGVGPAASQHLKEKGVTSAKQLFGHYCIKNESEFKEFVGGHAGKRAFEAMKAWDKQYLS